MELKQLAATETQKGDEIQQIKRENEKSFMYIMFLQFLRILNKNQKIVKCYETSCSQISSNIFYIFTTWTDYLKILSS